MKSSLLWPLFLLALVPRLILALTRTDLIWPDEHFQTLEPALQIVRGFGLLSWEWQDGFRSWWVPGIYSTLFWPLHILGINDGATWTLIARTLQAILSASIVPAAYLILMEIAPAAALGAALLTALDFPLIYWAAATLTETWTLALIPWVCWGALRLRKSKHGVWAGALLFTPALFRMQCLAWSGPALALFLLFYVPPRRWFLTATTALLPLAVLGGLDWITWGKPFFSIYNQLTQGVGKADFYGTSPWWDGIFRIGEAGGVWPVALFIGASVRALRLPTHRRDAAWLLLPSVIFWAAHCLIAHKETRFFVPPLALLPMSAVLGLPTLRTVSARTAWIGAALLATAFSMQATHANYYLSQVNTLWLERKIGRSSSVHEGDCILLVGHNWSWTRGYLAIGKRVDYREKTLEQLKDTDLAECKAAMVFRAQTRSFEMRSHWTRADEQSDFFLYWPSSKL